MEASLYPAAGSQVCSGDNVWDNGPRTLLSRVFLPSLFLFATAGVVLACHPKSPFSARSPPASGPGSNEEEDDLQQVEARWANNSTERRRGGPAPKKERLVYLDYWRTICVACVVCEHSGGKVYTHVNVCWVQQWVLPFLYAISAYGFMFSSSSMIRYQLRLLFVLSFGMLVNMVCLRVHGSPNWLRFSSVLFQMGFVWLVMMYSLIANPLKFALKWRAENPTSAANPGLVAQTALAGVFATAFLTIYATQLVSMDELTETGPLSQFRGTGATSFVEDGILVLAQLCASLFLGLLGCSLGRCDYLGWLMIPVVYMPRWVIAYDRGGHPFFGDLYMVSMVFKEFRPQCRTRMREYMILFLALPMLFNVPGTLGRCDLHPLQSWWMRLRFALVEVCLMIIFWSGAMNSSDTKRVSRWMNRWTLFAYCCHYGIYLVVPEPYSAFLTYASVVPFYLMGRPRRKSYEQMQEEKSLDHKGQAGIPGATVIGGTTL